ncbi:unnamed protein product [Caenorhabditis bovis]|uniref:DUF19 domain-containing protein n=1 Tax=Caenorhabditis bovis TaxID=2654633 RepID=A0A8S1F7D3_9PELO|nr:unnamed protein product [Caenorhabditis bovis]
MKLYSLIILALVLPLIIAECNLVKFNGCQAKFSDDLGIPRGYDWSNPLGLTLQIQNLYINGNAGERGLNTVCNAYNGFIKCLADSSSSTFECFDISWLLHSSTSPNNAYAYGFLMNMLQYQCGAGFYIASDNWDCVQRIYAGKNGTMYECINAFVINTQENPNHACPYVQTGLSCFEKAFRLQGCPEELKYYGCESFRQYSAPQFSICDETCEI